jgi:histidinol-phosphate aminotransferase
VQARVKLDQNESAHDFPAHLKALALERLVQAEWNRYPDMHADGLRAALARHEAWDADGILLTPGSNELIYALTQLAGINQRVLTVSPAFALYALGAKLLGSKLTEVPLEADFGLPVDTLERELRTGGPGILYLAEPHAPSGTLHDEALLERLIRASTGWIVALDEAYYPYSGRDHKRLVRQHPNVLILRTFSKAWGLAGARLGFMLSQPSLAREVQKILLPFNVNVLTSAVATVALEHPGYVEARVKEVIAERERLRHWLQEFTSWTAYPSQANYILIRVPDAAAVHRGLLEHGVLVRRQDSYPGLTGCLRITVGTPSENDALLSVIREIA